MDRLALGWIASPLDRRSVPPHLFIASLFAWAPPALLCLGCGAGTQPASTPPTPAPSAATAAQTGPRPGGVWSECYSLFSPTGEPQSDLLRLTRACGPTGNMRAVTPVQRATQAEKDPADRYTFYVSNPGACYRIYATADRNIQDLDLLLRAPDGSEIAADVTHDTYPVLPPAGPLCLDAAGLYMLEVSVFRGNGSYAIQVWGVSEGVGAKP